MNLQQEESMRKMTQQHEQTVQTLKTEQAAEKKRQSKEIQKQAATIQKLLQAHTEVKQWKD